MTVVLTRMIVAESDPFSLAFLRYGIGVLALLAVLVMAGPLPRVKRADFGAFIILGLLMFTCFPYFMTRALEDTTAAHGGLLFATMPLMTMIIGAVFRIEAMTRLKALGVALSLVGTAIALGEGVGDIAPNALRGDIYMLLGLFSATLFNVFSRPYLIRYGSLPVMVVSGIIGVFGLFGLALLFGQPFSGSLAFDLHGWFIVLMLGLPGAAVMLGFWALALKMTTPTRATITVGMNPLVAIGLGAVLLAEPFTSRILIGFALAIAAIIIANYKVKPTTAAPLQNGLADR